MRIARARLTAFRLDFRSPVATSRGRFAQREGVLLTLESDSGLQGWGEASPFPGFGLETPKASRKALEVAARALLGCDASDRDASRVVLEGSCAGTPVARSALEAALGDLRARERGLGLAELWMHDFGWPGAPEVVLPVNALVVGDAPEAVARSAREALASGCQTFKLKVGGQALAADELRLAALREVVGEVARIRLDANQAWSEGEARVALERFSHHRIEYVEQPLPAADLEGMARLRSGSAIPLAADEAAVREADVHAVIRAGAADSIVVKPSAAGGFEAAGRIVAATRAAGMGLVITSLLDSAVGVGAALHFAAAVAGGFGELPACGLATGTLFEADLVTAAPVEGGMLRLPRAGGLGIVPDPERLAACASEAPFELSA